MTRTVTSGHLALVPADPGPAIVAVSASMRGALAEADRYARSGMPILIIGETGTGKELIAHRIHARSGRPGELVAVNCAELVPEQAANQLFGHRRGAYTGANESTTGFVRRSSRGTLFLDEITSLPLESQPTLLRVIETGEVTPVGEDGVVRMDLRIVAAAHPDIGEQLERRMFRRDLFERLLVGLVQLRPLRERREDVLPLAEAFADALGCELAPGVGEVLAVHAWPGNVRELKAVVQRAAAAAAGGILEPQAFEYALRVVRAIRTGRPPEDHRLSERERLAHLCELAQGNWRRLMALMRVSKSTMYRRLKAHGLTLRTPAGSHISHPFPGMDGKGGNDRLSSQAHPIV